MHLALHSPSGVCTLVQGGCQTVSMTSTLHREGCCCCLLFFMAASLPTLPAAPLLLGCSGSDRRQRAWRRPYRIQGDGRAYHFPHDGHHAGEGHALKVRGMYSSSAEVRAQVNNAPMRASHFNLPSIRCSKRLDWNEPSIQKSALAPWARQFPLPWLTCSLSSPLTPPACQGLHSSPVTTEEQAGVAIALPPPMIPGNWEPSGEKCLVGDNLRAAALAHAGWEWLDETKRGEQG